MKFRCPYCRQVFGPEPSVRCPSCGKAMQLPPGMLVISPETRKHAKERISRDAEHQRRTSSAFYFRPGRNPVVLTIVALILLIVGSLLIRTSGSTRQARGDVRSPRMRAIDELFALRTAVERFRRDCGRYPTEKEGLLATIRDPGVQGWSRPYVNFIKPDPWRTRYVYTIVSNTVTVLSCGPDKKQGTRDDLVACDPDPDEVNADLVTTDTPGEEPADTSIPGALPPVHIGKP